MNKLSRELIHFILLRLEDARAYYHVARQLMQYTRRLARQHVDIRIVNCWHHAVETSATFRSVVWKGQPHPHDILITRPYICHHGEGDYTVNGVRYIRRRRLCRRGAKPLEPRNCFIIVNDCRFYTKYEIVTHEGQYYDIISQPTIVP